jgi:hypothetical protein
MSYFINPHEADRCEFWSCQRELPPVELAAARYEVNGELDQRHWNRMIVDVTQLQSIPTAAQLINHARAMASDVPRGARVALVVCPEQVRPARFVEKVARGLGVFLTYFLDPDKATDWVKRTTPVRQIFGRDAQEKP